MALTPAAVLIFRYNNPDALLTLLFVGAAYAFIRALETDRLRWVALAGILVGLAFETKLLQGYLVLPAFAITWAIAAPGSIRRRVAGLTVAALAVIVEQRLVGGRDRADPRGIPPLHRRQHQQLGARPGARLRRPGPDLRPGRWRRGPRRWRRCPGRRSRAGWRRWLLGHARAVPAVQRRARRPDRVAAPAVAGWPGERARRAVPRPSVRPRARRVADVGPVAPRPHRRVQLHVRHHPQLLRRGHGAGRRRPRGWRRGRAVARSRAVRLGGRGARPRDPRVRGHRMDAARADTLVRTGAGAGGGCRRGDRAAGTRCFGRDPAAHASSWPQRSSGWRSCSPGRPPTPSTR